MPAIRELYGNSHKEISVTRYYKVFGSNATDLTEDEIYDTIERENLENHVVAVMIENSNRENYPFSYIVVLSGDMSPQFVELRDCVHLHQQVIIFSSKKLSYVELVTRYLAFEIPFQILCDRKEVVRWFRAKRIKKEHGKLFVAMGE